MKVKKFTATNMQEAMSLIRAELGDNAVILNSKQVEAGGFLGFFTKKKLEVIAAVDPVTPTSVRQKAEPVQQSLNRPAKSSPGISPVQKAEAASLKQEIDELKRLINGINVNQGSGEKEYPEPFQQIDNKLKYQGIIEPLRLKIIKHLMKSWYEDSSVKKDVRDVEQQLLAYIKTILADVRLGEGFNKKIVNIVGPTGVGKTTTIAKLAAKSVLKEKKKVALITTDTYRISAVEQLKTYAKILNIPIKVSYSLDDFKEAVEEFSDYDLILVDSAGRNFRNKLYVQELSKIIDFEKEAETYLVLALTSKYEDMVEIIDQFSLIPIKTVILTKKDETSSYGAMINIPIQFGKGIAYITTGQDVPDDIVIASASYIGDCIVEVEGDE